jgi:hypothetical protein
MSIIHGYRHHGETHGMNLDDMTPRTKSLLIAHFTPHLAACNEGAASFSPTPPENELLERLEADNVAAGGAPAGLPYWAAWLAKMEPLVVEYGPQLIAGLFSLLTGVSAPTAKRPR